MKSAEEWATFCIEASSNAAHLDAIPDDIHALLCTNCARAYAAQECAALQEQILNRGRACAIWITGDPDDATELTTLEQAWGAIDEVHQLGQQRNDERNTLQQRVEVLEKAGKWADEFIVEPEWFPNEGDRQAWQEQRAVLGRPLPLRTHCNNSDGPCA